MKVLAHLKLKLKSVNNLNQKLDLLAGVQKGCGVIIKIVDANYLEEIPYGFLSIVNYDFMNGPTSSPRKLLHLGYSFFG